jgi:hypothetical protein
MILAIQVALDELNNSGDWCNYLDEEEVDRIMDGIQQIREQIEKLKEIYSKAVDSRASGLGGKASMGGNTSLINMQDKAGGRSFAGMGDITESFKEQMDVIEGMILSSAFLLKNEFINAWEEIFGEANSLFEKFMQNVIEQLLNLAAMKLATSFLSWIPGIGSIASAVGAIASGGNSPIVLKIGEEDVGTFVRVGNEYNRMRRLN